MKAHVFLSNLSGTADVPVNVFNIDEGLMIPQVQVKGATLLHSAGVDLRDVRNNRQIGYDEVDDGAFRLFYVKHNVSALGPASVTSAVVFRVREHRNTSGCSLRAITSLDELYVHVVMNS